MVLAVVALKSYTYIYKWDQTTPATGWLYSTYIYLNDLK